MEKFRICNICNKCFSNGKALGGHMRSHFSKLPVHPKPCLSSSSPLNNDLNPKKITMPQSFRSVNSFVASSDPSIQDPGSETDSYPKKPTRRRSKRRQRLVVEDLSEQVSSISETFSAENVAMCLLNLSRDSWTRKQNVKQEQDDSVDKGTVDLDAIQRDEDDDDDDDNDDSVCRVRMCSRKRAKYKCGTCKRTFRSYQALGGHRASHKKINNNININGEDDDHQEMDKLKGEFLIDQRVFECPFCDKVFDSGQALGGHKKFHFSHLGNSKKLSSSATSNKFGRKLIDLNLPAPEDDDDEVSQVEFSTVQSS